MGRLMSKTSSKVTMLLCAFVSLTVTCAQARSEVRFETFSAFVDAVGQEGLASPRLPETLASHGVSLVASGDSRGTLRGSDVLFDDGTSLSNLYVEPDTPTQVGRITGTVGPGACVKVDSLKAGYGMHDVFAAVTAPAPSPSPPRGPAPHARAMEGRVGKVTLGITYASVAGRPADADCVFNFGLR
ncbi:hypothetical protein KPL74_05990 [Bacillus sp. NP157]|nr:hypothetical protein KPL74_05990 [Bacillus sp. NP157]